MRARLLFALTALAGSPVFALAAPAPLWTVDKAGSQVKFASSLSGEAFAGVFKRWDAVIRFDPTHLDASSVTASIDPASATTGDADRDQALPGPVFFAAAKFPKATFEAHQFKAAGPRRFLAIGQLTLRGVSKPLTLPFTLAITGPVAKMTASVPLNRLAFGVGQNEWQSTKALPATVTVTIALTARKTP